MPDIDDFERDHHRHGGGIGWGEAFAALPQESPDAGGWQRVQARLPAPTRPRARWPLWLLALSLALRIAGAGLGRHDALMLAGGLHAAAILMFAALMLRAVRAAKPAPAMS